MTKEEARAEAERILEKDSSYWLLRSCWNCNHAHEHLKTAEVPINCVWCGHWYFKGVDITPDQVDNEGERVLPFDDRRSRSR